MWLLEQGNWLTQHHCAWGFLPDLQGCFTSQTCSEPLLTSLGAEVLVGLRVGGFVFEGGSGVAGCITFFTSGIAASWTEVRPAVGVVGTPLG